MKNTKKVVIMTIIVILSTGIPMITAGAYDPDIGVIYESITKTQVGPLITIWWNVKNYGNPQDDAEATWSALIQIEDDMYYEDWKYYHHSQNLPYPNSRRVGKSGWCFHTGWHWVRINEDCYDKFDECNEANNIKSRCLYFNP